MVSTTSKRNAQAAGPGVFHAAIRARPSSAPKTNAAGVPRRPRRVYEAAFKIMVVQEALKLPPSNRIKPTCRAYPGVEPVQIRKWIRNIAALQMAQPTAKLVQKRVLCPSPPDLVACDDGESSDTESVASDPHFHQTHSPAVHYPRGHAAPAHIVPFETEDGASSPYMSQDERCDVQGTQAPRHVQDWGDTMRVAQELLNLSGTPQ